MGISKAFIALGMPNQPLEFVGGSARQELEYQLVNKSAQLLQDLSNFFQKVIEAGKKSGFDDLELIIMLN